MLVERCGLKRGFNFRRLHWRNSGSYYVRHNPLTYMTDVHNSPTQQQNLVAFTQFPTDLASGNLPSYSLHCRKRMH
jgi:hypothetical protein